MLAAFDAKEFRRGGTRRPAAIGESTTPGGFFTQLAAGVLLSDERKFSKSFAASFEKRKKEFGVGLPGSFCSSFSLRRSLDGDHDRALEFAEALIEDVAGQIHSLRLNYLFLTPEKVEEVTVGGRKGERLSLSSSQFLRRAGNFMPVVSAWWLSQDRQAPDVSSVLLDHVEMPRTKAWTELTARRSPQVVPGGDEWGAAIAAADWLAWVSDMRLGAARLPLRSENLVSVWKDSPFSVEPFFFNERFLYAMKWQDSAPVALGKYWRRPMTFVMVDGILLSDTGQDQVDDADGPKVRLRDWVRERGLMDSVFAFAQGRGGGAKGYNPGDRADVQDGDVLVWIGDRSRARAEALASALDVETMSMKELRKKEKK